MLYEYLSKKSNQLMSSSFIIVMLCPTYFRGDFVYYLWSDLLFASVHVYNGYYLYTLLTIIIYLYFNPLILPSIILKKYYQKLII